MECLILWSIKVPASKSFFFLSVVFFCHFGKHAELEFHHLKIGSTSFNRKSILHGFLLMLQKSREAIFEFTRPIGKTVDFH